MQIRMDLLENSKDFLFSSLELFRIADEDGTHREQRSEKRNKAKWKLAFITLVQATELLLKYLLYLENPLLVFEDIDAEKINREKTVSASKLINRITNVGKSPFSDDEKDLLKSCFKIRNRFIHYDVEIDSERVKQNYAGLYRLYKKVYCELFEEKWIDLEELTTVAENIEDFVDRNLVIFRGEEMTREQREVFEEEIRKNSEKSCFIMPDGTAIKRLVFGEENMFLLRKGSSDRLSPIYDCQYCDDCGAKQGEYHLSPCDLEVCPVCGWQRLSCGCNLDL